jgi:hypothetical protein
MRVTAAITLANPVAMLMTRVFRSARVNDAKSFLKKDMGCKISNI